MSLTKPNQQDSSAQLRVEQIIQLCGQLPLAMSTSLPLALIVVAVLWQATNPTRLLSWLLAMSAINAWRMMLYFRQRSLARSDIQGHLALQQPLSIGSLASGVIWGASLLFYPAGQLPLELFHILVLTGVTAAATNGLAADRRALLLFQLAAMLPLALRLLTVGDTTHASMTVMVVVYVAYVIASSRRVNAQILENITLRIDALHRERQLHDSELRYRQLAHHDALTGLLNRHSLQARLPELLAHAARTETKVTLIYLDIDNFKDVNDSRGHGCGDQLLVIVAQRLQHCVGADDLVVRMGGDEFVIVTPHSLERESVERLARRIKSSVGEPLVLGGETVHVRVSIGIGIYPDDGVDAEVLMKYADIALYHAKARGRDNYQFFAPDMSHNFQERVFLEQALAQAIGTEQLFVQYQPLVDLPSGRTIGLEALTRWRHPERGLISPVAFIPIAEHNGLINALGEQLLRTVCRQLQAWQRDLVPLVPVAINVSPRQFEQDQLAGQLQQVTAEFGIDPHLLQIEITETALMKHIEGHGNTLHTLRELGVKVAIDDFGTGYSSLSYLKHLPIDCLKIDRSFVRDMVDDPRDAAIVSAVIGIARSLRINVVAEGVESLQQVEQLRALGCDAAQGYHFHRPMSGERCRPLLEQLNQQQPQTETLRLRVLRWVGAAG